MAFLIKLLYYGFWIITGVLCLFYLYTGLTQWSDKNNPLFIKQWLAVISIFGIYKLHKAYISAENHHQFAAGMYHVAMIWLCWAALLIVYLSLKEGFIK